MGEPERNSSDNSDVDLSRILERLDLRLQALENRIAGAARERTRVADLSNEDIATYARVRDVIAADFGEFCGINDCFRCIVVCRVCEACRVCEVCRVCKVCILECTCGPCGVGTAGGGGLDRFGDIGR
jgi:hypothetical protein